MFVCLEIDTEDIEIWAKIDMILANELGLTHVVWGTDKEKNNNTCILPSNLFYVHTSMPEVILRDKIMAVLNNNWNDGFKLMIMGSSWAYQSGDSQPKPSVPSGDIEDVVREE